MNTLTKNPYIRRIKYSAKSRIEKESEFVYIIIWDDCKYLINNSRSSLFYAKSPASAKHFKTEKQALAKIAKINNLQYEFNCDFSVKKFKNIFGTKF